MKQVCVLITGCGYKPVKYVHKYKGIPSHTPISIDGVEHKMNIGTACAFYLAKKGIEVLMVSKSPDKLGKIKDGLMKLGCKPELIKYLASNVASEKGIKALINKLPKDRDVYWVQSLGMGGGSYKIPGDNVYLPYEKISPRLIREESDIVIATHMMMLKLIQTFRKQIKGGGKAKISVITSMSGERGYHFGATHVSAKHALVGYIKGIEKELEDEGIEIRDIRPGGIDTGMYDGKEVRNAVLEISKRSKLWGGNKPAFASPLEVAKKVYDSLFGRNPKKVYRILGPNQR